MTLVLAGYKEKERECGNVGEVSSLFSCSAVKLVCEDRESSLFKGGVSVLFLALLLVIL